MKNILLTICLALITQNSYAGFITNSDLNDEDMGACKKNHQYILKKYANQLDSQILTLAKGIHFEVISKSSDEKVNEYKKTLMGIIVDQIVVQKMREQLSEVDFESRYSRNALPAEKIKKVFNLESIEVNLEFSIHSVLEHSIEVSNESESFKHYVLHTLEHDLIKHSIYLLGENVFKSISKSVMGKVIEGLTTKAILSFGHHLLEGAVVGTVVTILTEPLKGGRDSPEGIWTKILDSNPEFIINPEWMNKMGSTDLPWETHCRAIHNQTELMEKYLKNFIQHKSSDFSSKLMSIHQSWDSLPVSEQEGSLYKTEVDATKTVINVPFQESLPIWARGVIL